MSPSIILKNSALYTIIFFLCPLTLTSGSFSFSQWQERCKALTSTKSAFNAAELLAQLIQFNQVMNRELTKLNAWHEGNIPSNNFLRHIPESSHFDAPIESYVQKLIVPTDAQIAIHGDIHGDINACNNFIRHCINMHCVNDTLEIINPRFYMVLLGDYVDRGPHGNEVLHILMKLKCVNPSKVVLIRGNHESQQMNQAFGFFDELQKKYPNSPYVYSYACTYKLMPLALYLGCATSTNKYLVMCCHGGIELGYDPKSFLSSFAQYDHIKMLDRSLGLFSLSTENIDPIKNENPSFFIHTPLTQNNGFMWSDFCVDPTTPTIQVSSRGSGILEFDQKSTKSILHAWSSDKHIVHCIFRAHQHADEPMRRRILNLDHLSHYDDTGVGKLWINQKDAQSQQAHSLQDISVITLGVSPAALPNYPYDAFGLVTTGDGFDKWNMRVIRQPDPFKPQLPEQVRTRRPPAYLTGIEYDKDEDDDEKDSNLDISSSARE